jgi:hypothetical protein
MKSQQVFLSNHFRRSTTPIPLGNQEELAWFPFGIIQVMSRFVRPFINDPRAAVSRSLQLAQLITIAKRKHSPPMFPAAAWRRLSKSGWHIVAAKTAAQLR